MSELSFDLDVKMLEDGKHTFRVSKVVPHETKDRRRTCKFVLDNANPIGERSQDEVFVFGGPAFKKGTQAFSLIEAAIRRPITKEDTPQLLLDEVIGKEVVLELSKDSVTQWPKIVGVYPLADGVLQPLTA
ncbi:MAG: hypothetical protein JNL74_09110 [Fibrobacteres bacterium]|nr:hypothetical protein [Fibrobacterota bacterium]